MGIKVNLCISLLLAMVMYHEVSSTLVVRISSGSSEDERCKYDNSNDPIFNCTECLWKKGCQWCEDKDPDLTIPRSLVRGCLKDPLPDGIQACDQAYQSQVGDDNENRYNAIRNLIKADETTERQLTPPAIPSAHTPIILNPQKDGEALFRIKISRAHPVDLYALMDLSGSMDEHRKNLAHAADAVAKAIEKETADYRLAFGGFRDKPKTPFGGVADCPIYDVGFALDVSGSVGKANWKKEQQFTKAIANFADVSESGGRVSLITFQSSAYLRIKFSDYKTHAGFSHGVNSLYYSGGGTRIDRALRMALDSMFKSWNGMRDDTSKMMILITDGQSSDGQFTALREEFKQKKILLLVVGVGNVKASSLRKLVLDEKDLFIANNFDDLNKRFTKSVGQSICTGSKEWDYSYHHIQSFTKNVAEFTQKITASTVNGGADDFEAGLDGLMQTIVCEDDIWSSSSSGRSARKIIVYFSDQGVHSGGDGSTAGLLKPSGFKCHLKTCTTPEKEDPEGCTSFANAGVLSYRDQLTRDYPSYSQIRSVINQNNINMIFAVTAGIQDYYKKFATYIGQAGNVGELKEDANQMEQLIKEQYDKITRSVKVVDNKEQNQEIKVTFELDTDLSESSRGYTCPSNAGFSEDQLECTGTKNDDQIWVKAHLNVDTYTCKNNPTGTKNIHLFQFNKDQLNLDYKCETCDCMENKVPDAKDCNFQGTLACGGCTCNPGYKGRLCECEEGKHTNDAECQLDNGVECSNRGTCECGKCQCDPSYVGKCCQFPDCKKGLCGGLEVSKCGGKLDKACSGGNGKCVITHDLEDCDGESTANCNCSLGANNDVSRFTGELCECCESGECRKECFNRFTDGRAQEDMCTGRGKCECGAGFGGQKIGQKCKCNSGVKGDYCQKNDDVCKLLEPCVKYRMTANDETKNENSDNWKNKCKDNLNQLGFANKKDESITRVGCHEITNGTLSEFFYFTANESLQDGNRYCESVMSSVEDPSGTLEVFQKSTKAKKMQQCVMEGSADVNCTGCHIRFYHNTIDSNEIFAPIGEEDLQLAEPEVYVVMHNQTEDGKWQFCLDCKNFPITIVLISTIGTVFAILLGLLIASIVIINVNDYRVYKQFLANKNEAEGALKEMQNPHFVDPNQKTENPMFQQTK